MLMTGDICKYCGTWHQRRSNDGLFYGNPDFFFTQLKAMAIVVRISVSLFLMLYSNSSTSYFHYVFQNSKKKLGLDATQHNEKYMQGHLLVPITMGKWKETPVEKLKLKNK